MRKVFPDVVEKGRSFAPPFDSKRGDKFGAFFFNRGGVTLKVIACEGSTDEFPEWDHVSVSARSGTLERCPTWDEMCWVKNLFFDPAEWVVQFHPAEADYVNVHPHVLHLWRPCGVALPIPPKELV